MSLDVILNEARRYGIRLWIEGDRLRYEAPKGPDADRMLRELKPHRAALLDRLRDSELVTVHPVSFGQRALWFEYQLNPASPAYNYSFSAMVRSELNVPALRRALQAIVDRHAILRTKYAIQDGEPVQRVHAWQPVAFAAMEASDWTAAQLEDTVRASAHQPFDLRNGPIFRVELYSRSADHHLLLLNAHHIAMDFQSLAVMIEELGHLYAVESGQALPPLPVVKTQYADVARWQADLMAGPAGDKHWQFWQTRLAGELPLLNLPTDRPRPAVRTYNGASLAFDIGPELCRRLKDLARAQRVTLYTLLVASFDVLLGRYSGQDEFLIGSPMLGRTRSEFQRVMGYCINPVVLRADLAGDPTFAELLHRVHADVLSAMEHHDCPFPLLVQRLQPTRDASRSPFFDVMFNLNTAQVEDAEQGLRLAGGTPASLVLEAQPQAQGEGQFDIILQIFDSGRSLSGALEYNTDLFDPATMQRMAGHLRQLLAAIVADPHERVSTLPLLTASERQHLRLEDAAPLPRFPVAGTLCELFEQQVARTPDAPALTFEDRTLTYRQLNEQANQLGWRLRGLGVGPETLVGICLERSAELVIGLLGILKAGGAYVPIDPAYPKDRQAHMLADSNAPVLLTQELLLGQIPSCSATILCLDRDWSESARESVGNPPPVALPSHPAYVIYTSGSTGKPKGVVVCHEQVVRLFTATQHWYGFGERDVWTLFHSCAFDFSVWELWGALLYGGRLVVVPYLVSRSPEAFVRLLARERVTVLNQTPSAFRQLIAAEAVSPLPKDSPLRYVIFGGEALDPQSLGPWYQRHGDRQPVLVNMYGITETTVHVTYRPLGQADVQASHGSMIGEPIPDLELYVLDAHGQPVPLGVPGELHVGGAGLARGYLNQPELTAERFIAHPFTACSGARLYRTGDLARRTTSGDLEYVGRVDQQVKIRGFRIEIEEIESVLKQCPGIADALVIAIGELTADKRLVAYIRATGEPHVSVDGLRQHARTKLPEYMVPAAFVFLEAFALTPSGKIDRKALPAPGADRPELESTFLAPATAAEQVLADVWAEVLSLERVGVNDNFFSLGGDSILSIQVVAGAKQRGITISLADVFQHQTIRELVSSSVVCDAVPSAAPRSVVEQVSPFALLSEADIRKRPAGIEDAYPLSRLQVGMLFHAQLNPGLAIYSNLSSIHVRVPFNESKLRQAIDRVAGRHPALRTAIDMTGYSEPLQLVHRQVRVPLVVEDVRCMAGQEQQRYLDAWIERERARDFDTSQAPLLRFHVHRRADDRLQLTWAEHHAILDGWSVATMLAEIVTTYLRLLGHSVPAEQAVPAAACRDFIALERETIESDERRRFWSERLAGAVVTRLPRWRRASDPAPHDCFRHRIVHVPTDVSRKLQEVARTLRVPVKSVLLAAHLKVLAAWTGQREVVTGLISNGRPETADSDRVLGLFLNTVPLRESLEPGTWQDLVRRVHAGENDLLPHRRYPLADIQRAIGMQDLIETSFNFIHFHVYQSLAGLGPIEVLDTIAFERTNFTLMATFSLEAMAERSDVGLTLHYDAAELPDEQVAVLAESYQLALESLAIAPAARHDALCLLPGDHRRRLLVEFNETAVARPVGLCLHQLVEAQAARTPERIAVVAGPETLTYRDLDERSNRLARHLRAHGVGPEVLVGVCMPRRTDLVIALLAVLKAGGAYVPLDAGYPPQRLDFILNDARAGLLLTTADLRGRFGNGSSRIVCLDREQAALQSLSPDPLNDCQLSPSNLAYVIYTSGSTGTPKGVAIEHRSAVELMHWARDNYSDAELAGVLAATSICFDLSIFEMFIPLSCGGRAIVVDNALALADLGPAAGVTLVNTVPSAMAEVLRIGGLPSTVQTVNLAGEPLSPRLVDAIYALGTVQRVMDLYGPSEDTTYSTAARRQPNAPATIGRPISNTRVYILDPDLQPVPAGAVGEFFIAGDGLARGYLRRADLTAERFLPDPYGPQADARMYRTGDLGRYLPDGDIEFLGRSDHQVKLRGFRIELGEIEAALCDCPGIREAVVTIAGHDGDPRLVGYYVTQAGAASEEGDLLARLAARLPAYMVPVGLVQLSALPLTPNGKVDRRALPAWNAAAESSDVARVAPRDPIEAAVAECWREVLGVPAVGVEDNFFRLGGHSLLATQVVSRLRETLDVPLALRSLFDSPTVAGLAAVLRQMRGSHAPGDRQEREEIEL
jgi:amino acid adenylation domain-containing protein